MLNNTIEIGPRSVTDTSGRIWTCMLSIIPNVSHDLSSNPYIKRKTNLQPSTHASFRSISDENTSYNVFSNTKIAWAFRRVLYCSEKNLLARARIIHVMILRWKKCWFLLCLLRFFRGLVDVELSVDCVRGNLLTKTWLGNSGILLENLDKI